MNYSEKRLNERIPSGENILITYKSNIFMGTILNLSEIGMFIGTKTCFPPDSTLLLENDYIKIQARVKRTTEMNGYYDGVGVELPEPSHKYLDFINSMKAPI